MRTERGTWNVVRTLRVRGSHERERREVRDADVLRAVHLMQPQAHQTLGLLTVGLEKMDGP